MSQIIVLTGANSYVGRNIRRIVESLHFQVFTAGRSDTDDIFYDLTLQDSSRFSLSTQFVLIHCAHSHLKEDESCFVNENAISNLFDNNQEHLQAMIYVSSASAKKEATKGYGKVKYACEQIVTNNSKGKVLKLGFIPDPSSSFVAKFLYMLSRLPFAIAPKNSSKTFFVSDWNNISAGLSFLLDSPSKAVISVGDSKKYTFPELLNFLTPKRRYIKYFSSESKTIGILLKLISRCGEKGWRFSNSINVLFEK